MDTPRLRPGRFGLLAGVDVFVLMACRPDLGRLAGRIGQPYAWLAADGADRAGADLARLGLWLTALWVACGVLATVGAAVPGATGRFVTGVVTATMPRALRAFLAGSVGVSVTLVPLVPAVATPASATPAGASAPAVSGPATASSSGLDVPWPHTSPDPPDRRAEVVVRAGDSLWLIAARRAGAEATEVEITDEWHRWYRTNTDAVGPDPDLIHPGLHLRAPSTSGRSS